MTAMQLKYHILDVFTEQRYSGNPLAVIRDADAIDGDTMQKIARELNLSETVFIQTSTRPAHSAKLRILRRPKNCRSLDTQPLAPQYFLVSCEPRV